MPEEDELAFEDSVTLDMLAGRPGVIFERRMHPPVYDAVMRLAEERKIAPARLHHIVAPEDAYSFIADELAHLTYLYEIPAAACLGYLILQILCLILQISSRNPPFKCSLLGTCTEGEMQCHPNSQL
jgi:hypothetical protein